MCPHHTRLALLVITALSACTTAQDKSSVSKQAHEPAPVRHPVPSDQASPIESGETVAALDNHIWIVFQAKDDAYWFGSDGQGVYRYDGTTITQFTTRDGLCNDGIRGIQEDKSGNVYIYAGNDVSKFDGRKLTTLIPKGDGSAWKLDPDDLWFPGGQDSGAVYRYDGETLHRLVFPRTPAGDEHYAESPRSEFPNMKYSPYDVYTIFKDSQGSLWFGTAILGVCRYDGESFAWIPTAELGFDIGGEGAFGVRSIAEVEQGKLFVTDVRYRFDVHGRDSADLIAGKQKGFRIGPENGPEEVFMSMLTDEHGDLWMAALGGGVWRYDGEHVTHYPVRYDGEDIWVFSIYRDRQGALWLGTHEHGVYKFNGTAFEPFEIGSGAR